MGSGIETIRVLVVMPFEGIFLNKGNIRVWFTNDARRIPLRMKAKVVGWDDSWRISPRMAGFCWLAASPGALQAEASGGRGAVLTPHWAPTLKHFCEKFLRARGRRVLLCAVRILPRFRA